MPNTLAHMGIQAVLTRRLVRHADPKWIYLGCLIPDFPWIAQRAVQAIGPVVDPYVLRLYCIVQSSLLFCLVLCLAFAVLSLRPLTLFAILALGSILHLLLDSLETKWANGVILWAPVDWRLMNFGLFWPESAPVAGLSMFGLAYCLFFWRTAVGQASDIGPPSARRATAAAGILAIYLGAPLLMLEGPANADNHFVRTLSAVEQRPGRPVELDRADYFPTPRGALLLTFADELINAEGLHLGERAAVSIRGRFTSTDRIQVITWHRHQRGLRDYQSYVGILMIAALWSWHAVWAFSSPALQRRFDLTRLHLLSSREQYPRPGR
jgi:hypothetical protein